MENQRLLTGALPKLQLDTVSNINLGGSVPHRDLLAEAQFLQLHFPRRDRSNYSAIFSCNTLLILPITGILN